MAFINDMLIYVKQDHVHISQKVLASLRFSFDCEFHITKNLWEKLILQAELYVIEGDIVLSQEHAMRLSVIINLYFHYQQLAKQYDLLNLNSYPASVETDSTNQLRHGIVGFDEDGTNHLVTLYLLDNQTIHSQLLGGSVAVVDEETIQTRHPNLSKESVRAVVNFMNEHNYEFADLAVQRWQACH